MTPNKNKWYVVAGRIKFKDADSILTQVRSLNTAIKKADSHYLSDRADRMAVIEVSPFGRTKVVYKVERICKHPNQQYVLTSTGITLKCEKCKEELSQ